MAGKLGGNCGREIPEGYEFCRHCGKGIFLEPNNPSSWRY